MQGFSVGGEYAGAMVYIAESSPDNKRIRLGSGLELGTLSGYIFASVLINCILSDGINQNIIVINTEAKM